MANIPVGNFGDAVAQPGSAPGVPRMDVSSGVENLASDVGRAWQDYQGQQNGARAALALATTNNDLRDAHDEVSRGVLNGTISTDDAQEQFNARAEAIGNVNSQGLTQQHAAMLRAQSVATVGDLKRSLNGVVIQRQQSETAATIDQTGEQLQRDAVRRGPAAVIDSYGAILDLTGAGAGWTPEQIATKKQAFTEKTTWAYFDQKGTQQLAANDMAGLASTIAEVMGPAGDPMDPVRRAQVTHQLIGFQNHLAAEQRTADNQAMLAAQAREKQATEAYKEVADLVVHGQYLSPQAITNASAVITGTSWEPLFRQAVASQATVAGFASLPASQRAATMEDLRSRGADPSVGTDPATYRMGELYEKIDGAVAAAAKDNPWDAAQKYGVIPRAQTLTPSDIPSSLAVMQQRMSQIDAVEAWAGHKVSPLQPVEAENLAKMIHALPVDQQAAALTSFGATVGDPDRIAAVAHQIAPKEPTMALAMAYAGMNTTGGRQTAELVLRGEQALKDDTALVDKSKDTGWRATIAKTIRGAYQNQEVEDQTIQAAYLIAAGQYAQTGSAPDLDNAVNLATGGIIQHGSAGAKIPLPYGMKESQFNDALSHVTPQSLKPQAPDGLVYAGRTAMDLTTLVRSLPDATLVHAGQGLYNVRAGSYLVTNKDGQRVTIKVTP